MIEFSDNEVTIGKALLDNPMDAVELRKATGISADELIPSLKRLMSLRVVVLKGQKYTLVDRIIEKAGGDQDYRENYTVHMIIEGASRDLATLEAQMTHLVERIKKESILVHDLELAEPEESDGVHATHIELEYGADSFDNVVHMIQQYGPSTIEMLEPETVTLKPKEIHDTLVEIANSTHYYVGLAVNQGMQIRALRNELKKVKNELREKEIALEAEEKEEKKDE